MANERSLVNGVGVEYSAATGGQENRGLGLCHFGQLREGGFIPNRKANGTSCISMTCKHYDIKFSVALVGLFRDLDKIFCIVALPYNKTMCLGEMTHDFSF